MGLIQSVFYSLIFCVERVLTYTCCAVVLILFMFTLVTLTVYGISVGYHYAQKELASYSMSSRSTTTPARLLGERKHIGQHFPWAQYLPPQLLPIASNSIQDEPPEPSEPWILMPPTEPETPETWTPVVPANVSQTEPINNETAETSQSIVPAMDNERLETPQSVEANQTRKPMQPTKTTVPQTEIVPEELDTPLTVEANQTQDPMQPTKTTVPQTEIVPEELDIYDISDQEEAQNRQPEESDLSELNQSDDEKDKREIRVPRHLLDWFRRTKNKTLSGIPFLRLYNVTAVPISMTAINLAYF